MSGTGSRLRLPVLLLGMGLLAGPVHDALAMESEPLAEADATIRTETVTDLIEQAEAARLKASQLRAEWLETASLIEQARKELTLGNLQGAANLAILARQEGELAAAQAERESTAWQSRVVR